MLVPKYQGNPVKKKIISQLWTGLYMLSFIVLLRLLTCQDATLVWDELQKPLYIVPSGQQGSAYWMTLECISVLCQSVFCF